MSTLLKKKENNLSIYFTAGFPRLNDTTEILNALNDSGADLVEVGMPYSDPMADGPTIQESSSKAIANGINTRVIFDQLMSVKDDIEVPVVLMGYFNQILQFGEEAFFEKCKDAGVRGLIIPDLPMEEYESEFVHLFEKYGLINVFLITPQTSEERIRKIDALSKSFIYVVSSSSITGAKEDIDQQQQAYFDRINSYQLSSPLLIGFGISNAETFSQACKNANGAIIGSAFIKHLAQTTNIKEGVADFIDDIRKQEPITTI